ncbi:RhuM family protein [Anaerotalea alkaliphila]|uniref:Virulence protein RhuM/Fic/DOC family protein n=1 Tax=Anaerotalea alkaliphila TaxID=2662126 RepID=A0A7X5HU24_9FIRM|nr:RhuM family protein [Anaerotalea alkaliphila]NDL66666.1 virulence protein RhuM/Fic/DOC family protein [Anaerotalea alkaliphila]
MKKEEVVLFVDGNVELEVSITPDRDTVWLTQEQMSLLFDTARSSIAYHIKNIFKEQELDKSTSVEIFDRSENKASRPPMCYNLDVIISVGYRVKSKRGVAFRKWANGVLKQYIMQGYAVNHKRIKDLGEVIRIMKRTENSLDAKQVLSVIERYNTALELLDDYDHQRMKRPKGSESAYVLSYDECIQVIQIMRFGNESELFGKEKDDSFQGSIGNIYQSFSGNDVYPSLEEKAANLLYFVTKNHSFLDGNKRIAAMMFLHFLDKNGVLFADEHKLIDNHTLVALTIMIAESKPDEKEMMISIIMNCIG